MTDELRAAVTVAEMARMLRLSRSRLYQLIGTAFPEPSRDDRGRPYYDAEQQAECAWRFAVATTELIIAQSYSMRPGAPSRPRHPAQGEAEGSPGPMPKSSTAFVPSA